MNDKVLNTLEYTKILAILGGFAETSLGKQAALGLRPSGKLEEVKQRLQTTDEAVNIVRLKGQAPFGGISDIREAVKRANLAGMLNPSELLSIANTLYGGRRIKRFISSVNGEYAVPSVDRLAQQIHDFRELEEAIKRCIDELGEVLDSASAELSRIRHDIRTGEHRVRERLEQMIRNPSTVKMLQDPIITLRGDRYVIPVKLEYRGAIGGIVHDQSASGATLFIEPEAIVVMNNKLRELKLREQQEIERILQILTAQVADAADGLLANSGVLAELDFIFAKAQLAHEWRAALPRMNDRGYLRLRKARHPLIAADAVVPIDVELGNSYTALIVTGPNTGGKTVSIKTIGLLNLLAMSGLFIPAEDGSQCCVFDAVYADIGDEQSIEQSLSTFSSHLTNIIRILREMTPKSLVLLDELGAGTDPAEGSALAISLLEHIHQLGCRIVATTHYSELKAYAYDHKGVINASVEFDVDTLSPTYRLLVGVPGRSNAFAIAERLGLPRSIIEHARGQVGEEDRRVESMIASLEQNRLSTEADRLTAAAERQEVERLRRELGEERKRFSQQRERLLEKAERDAAAAVAKARSEAEQVIAELRQLALAEGASIKEHRLIEARRRLDAALPELTGERKSAAEGVDAGANKLQAQLGDEVAVASLGGQVGIIVEEAGRLEWIVQLGALKMKVKKSDVNVIGSARQAKPLQQASASNVKRTRDEQVRTELDLRGTNLEEAILEADRFLDEAFMNNLSQVYIIHGKGTGVLRTGIQEFLRKHRLVKQFRLGNYGEGGAGVTIAEL